MKFMWMSKREIEIEWGTSSSHSNYDNKHVVCIHTYLFINICIILIKTQIHLKGLMLRRMWRFKKMPFLSRLSGLVHDRHCDKISISIFYMNLFPPVYSNFSRLCALFVLILIESMPFFSINIAMHFFVI